MCAVDINGFIYPCQRFVGIQKFIMGDVNGSLSENNDFLSNIHIKNHLQCHSCWVKNLCLGHCPNENYQSTGFVNMTNERVCTLNKEINEALIRVYLRMGESLCLKLLA